MWNSKVPKPDRDSFLSELVYHFGGYGPLSSEFAQMYLDKHFAPLISAPVPYGDVSVRDAIGARQIQALFSKDEDLKLPGVDKEATAVAKFLGTEAKCCSVNSRPIGDGGGSHVHSVLHGAERKIHSILGPAVALAAFSFAFGPGATTSVKAAEACFKTKLSARLACSTNLEPYVADFLSEVPHLAAHHSVSGSHPDAGPSNSDVWVVPVDVVHGRLQFVPKTALTHRSIVVEPHLNGFFQKGVGSYLKQRLLRAGVNLFDQSRNQRLAREGSIGGHLATIDLSSASDSISSSLVLDLLWKSDSWFELLDALRTPTVDYRGTVYRLEKFSSMGNAFTFELESMIFYALALSVCEHLGLPTQDVSVYGDDIIVPVEAVGLLYDVLEAVGFTVNAKKSFFTGPFRESCGTDWYQGIDIRPHFLRRTLRYSDLFSAHNAFIRTHEYEAAQVCLDAIPPHLRLWGPDGYGDGHLIGTYSLRTNREIRRRGWGGGLFDTYRLKPRKLNRLYPGDWQLPVYTVYVRSGLEGPTDTTTVRGTAGVERVSIYTLASTVFCR